MPGPKGTMLIVEDEALTAMYLRQELEYLGYEVAASVTSGDAALRLLSTTRVDVVLMDIRLQGAMDGIATAARIRQAFDIPVVYLTAHTDAETLQRAKRTGPYGYLPKPIEVEVLRTTVETALATHTLERQFSTTVLKSIGEAVLTTDTAGVLTFLNPVAEALTGWSRDEVVGKEVTAVLHLKDATTQAVMAPALMHLVMRQGMALSLTHFAFSLARRDGGEVPVDGRVVPLRERGGRVTGTLFVCRDLRDRQQAEEREQQTRDQLRALSSRLLAVQEEERRRLAHDVHDELGQALTALKFDLAWLDQHLPAQPASLQQKTASMLHAVDATIHTVRRIVATLRPRILDDFGLGAALEWQVQNVQQRTGLACTLRLLPEAYDLDPERSTTVFRLVQEALTNIVRHAQATQVTVELRLEAATLVLTVQDNGRGVDPARLAAPDTFGVLGMRERLLAWGGELSIQGTPGRGTLITARVPLTTRREGHGPLPPLGRQSQSRQGTRGGTAL